MGCGSSVPVHPAPSGGEPTPTPDESARVHALQARIVSLEELLANANSKLESREADLTALQAQLAERLVKQPGQGASRLNEALGGGEEDSLKAEADAPKTQIALPEGRAAEQEVADAGVLQALVDRNDEAAVRKIFEARADRSPSGAGPQGRLSKDALKQALADLHIPLDVRDEGEADELMARADLNGDGSIDAEEFQVLVGGNTLLEMLLQGLSVHRALAHGLGGSMEAFRKMPDSEIDARVRRSMPLVSGIIKKAVEGIRAAEQQAAERSAAGGAKFAFEIRGGTLKDYYAGLSDRVGAAPADVAKGVEKEHLKSGDCDIRFRTGNYNILTTPRTEYELVISGGKGLKKGDERVLRPLDYYTDRETVKGAGLTPVEIVMLVMYTGPMFQLYNARLRGFGHCGVVEEGVEPVSVKERCEKAGNSYASSIHVLASAIQKLQTANGPEKRRGWLYRGLGGGALPPGFIKFGLLEWAFMSMSKSLLAALAYSGVKQGLLATVLRIELSDVDGAASIEEFSQYPSEEEFVWNVLTFLQYLVGKEELMSTPHGLVRMITVKANSNGQVLTIEQLASRRKDLHLASVHHNRGDLVRAIESRGDVSEALKASVLRQFGELEERHRACEAQRYNDDHHYRALVAELLDTLRFSQDALDFKNDTCFLREAFREEVQKLERQVEAAAPGSEERRSAALKLCRKRGLVDVDGLEALNEMGESPLIQAAADGEVVHVRLLLEASANVLATNQRHQGPLVDSACGGYVECVRELLCFKADVHGVDEFGAQPVCHAAMHGHEGCVLELLRASADVNAADDENGDTALLHAALSGHEGCVRELLGASADVNAADNDGDTALMLASRKGHEGCVRLLQDAGASVE